MLLHLIQSGIGVGGQPKEYARLLSFRARHYGRILTPSFSTAFGLYRDGTELRGVYYSKPEVAREACFSLGDQCDYPILVGASVTVYRG